MQSPQATSSCDLIPTYEREGGRGEGEREGGERERGREGRGRKRGKEGGEGQIVVIYRENEEKRLG